MKKKTYFRASFAAKAHAAITNRMLKTADPTIVPRKISYSVKLVLFPSPFPNHFLSLFIDCFCFLQKRKTFIDFNRSGVRKLQTRRRIRSNLFTFSLQIQIAFVKWKKCNFLTCHTTYSDVVHRDEHANDACEELRGGASSGHESSSGHIWTDLQLEFKMLSFNLL